MYINDNLIHYVNFGVLTIFAVFILLGLKNGFLKQMLSLLRLVVVVLLSWLYAPVFAKYFILYKVKIPMITNTYLAEVINYRFNYLLWFIIIFVAMSIVLSIVNIFINKITDISIFKYFNVFLGGILGFIKGAIVIYIVSAFLANAYFLNGIEFKEKTVLKYYDQIVVKTLSIGDGVFRDSAIIQDFFAHPEQLTEENRKIVADWLKKNNYGTAEIEKIFDSVKVN